MAAAMLFGGCGCVRATVQPIFYSTLRAIPKQPPPFARSAINSKSFSSWKPFLPSHSLKPAPSPSPSASAKSPVQTSRALIIFSRRQTSSSLSPTAEIDQNANWRRAGLAALGIGVAIAGLNTFLNRETRERMFTDFERDYINKSFVYLGAGLALTAVAARMMWVRGLPLARPGMMYAAGIGGSLVSLFGMFYTPPQRTFLRHAWWTTFNLSQAAFLSPFYAVNPALLSRAALYTLGVMGSITYIGATAKEEKYLYLGGPLLAGLIVVALSSLSPLVLPATATRALATGEAVSLYGGLAVFSGLILYDVQRLLADARMAEEAIRVGQEPPVDPMREAISLELDFINIFFRMVQLLAGRESGGK